MNNEKRNFVTKSQKSALAALNPEPEAKQMNTEPNYTLAELPYKTEHHARKLWLMLRGFGFAELLLCHSEKQIVIQEYR